ncbi:MAG: pseudouridine synthase [Thermotogota bacterium]
MRLDRFLSNAKIGTRSEVKKYINKGKVKVNDKIIKKSSHKLSKEDEVYFKEKKVVPYHDVYIMLNKPKNYVCATIDNLHSTVIDLIDHPFKNDLSIAGRLDIDTTGMVLLSNDGNFVHKVISPENKVFKRYIIKYSGKLTEEKINKIKNGIDLADFKTLPAKIKEIDENTLMIEIREGKFHQIKRMISAIDLTLESLERVKIGELSLDIDLGKWRALNEKDIKKIFEL